MTRETLNKLSETARLKVENFRKRYSSVSYKGSAREMRMAEEIRMQMASYVEGLRDAGLITERERQVLFVYMTVELREV